MRAPNTARGEVALTVGGEDLIICATIGGLAQVSAAVKAETLHELYTKIGGGEPNACLAVLGSWTVAGNTAAAVENLKLPDLLKIGQAATAAMASHMDGDDDGGKPAAGTESD